MDIYSFFYNNKKFEYTLIRKNIKRVNLRINSKGEIIVSAPFRVPFKTINDFVVSKAYWIDENIEKIKLNQKDLVDNKIYDNKNVYFIGEMFKIQIHKDNKNFIERDLNNKVIRIYTKHNDDESIKIQYMYWLSHRACEVFLSCVERMRNLLSTEYNVPFPKITVRNMKTRWGSCTPAKKSIRLNLQLIKADIECIEEVALHEIVHFIHQNHSKDFYGVMEKYMPDYKKRGERLKKCYKDGI